MAGTSFGYSRSPVDQKTFNRKFDSIKWNGDKPSSVKMGKDRLPRGSKLTKFQYQANEICHDVLKPDVKKMVKEGDIVPVPGAKFFGYDMRDVMNDRV
jgi:hypothetical protein